MGRRHEKSDLETVVERLGWTLRVQKIRRPEEWVRWGAIPAIWYGTYAQSVPFMVGALVVSGGAAYLLFRRRLGGGTPGELVARSLPEAAIESARRGLRRGTYDAQVGPEAAGGPGVRAPRLTSPRWRKGCGCTSSTRGQPAVLEAFRATTSAADDLMRAAISRAQEATMLGRLPQAADLADLRAIEAGLVGLAGEAQVLAQELRPDGVLPESARLAQAERAEARRELDQGA